MIDGERHLGEGPIEQSLPVIIPSQTAENTEYLFVFKDTAILGEGSEYWLHLRPSGKHRFLETNDLFTLFDPEATDVDKD